MSSESTFGQNDWLVDEMFQQYQDDPNSVDDEWRELFKKHGKPVDGDAAPLTTTRRGRQGCTSIVKKIYLM